MEVQLAQVRQTFEWLESIIGDLCAGDVQLLEVRQRRSESEIVDRASRQVEGFEPLELVLAPLAQTSEQLAQRLLHAGAVAPADEEGFVRQVGNLLDRPVFLGFAGTDRQRGALG